MRMKNRLFRSIIRLVHVSIFFCLLFFFSSPVTAHAAITQLTSDSTAYSFNPHRDGNAIVWQTLTASNSSNIYFYDIASGSASQITTNDTYNTDPQISGNDIVWIASDSATKIVHYDINTATTTIIADNVKKPAGLQIESGFVVWAATNVDDRYAIYGYDIAEQSLKELSTTAIEGNLPQLNGGKVLWKDFNFFEYKFFVYDIASDTTKQIQTDVKNYNSFRLNLNTITGFDTDNNISVYNIATPSASKIITGTTDNAQAQFHSSYGQNYVFWGGFDGEDYHIYAYFMSSGVITQLTVNNYNNLNSGTTLTANSQRVMWDTPDGVIRVFDNITKTVTNLTEGQGYYPDMSDDGVVVWTVDQNDSSQVYMWDGIIPANHAPVITPLKDQVVNEDDTLEFHVEATSNDGDNVTLNVSSLPIGATYDPLTQIVSWKPTQGQAGEYMITITAKDDETPSEMSVYFVPVIVFDMSPEQKTIRLGAAIIDYHLDTDVELAYLTSQQSIYTYLQSNQIHKAKMQLNWLIRQINTDYENNKIPKQAHFELMHEAQSIVGILH